MMEVRLRPAMADDADRLLAWANASDSLAAKLRTSAPIQRSAHAEWLARRLADPATRISIVLDGDVAVGQVRVERRDDAWEVDVYVDPTYRRRGIARQALVLAFADLSERDPGATLRARVRTENTPSRRLFLSLGFRETARLPDHVVLERESPEPEAL